MVTRWPIPFIGNMGKRSWRFLLTVHKTRSTSSSPQATKMQRQKWCGCVIATWLWGTGPEHSSARMERFLQMCAELIWWSPILLRLRIYFNAFRRQLTWSFRKTIDQFFAESNLRNPVTFSHISGIHQGGLKNWSMIILLRSFDVKKVVDV